MSILEALKGAQAELARISSPLEKARRVATYARIFTAELLGTVLAAPYGFRALTLHRSLPHAGVGAQQKRSSVSILRDVRYGERPRNVMDIYLPPNTTVLELPPQLGSALASGTSPAAAAAPLPDLIPERGSNISGSSNAGSSGGRGSAAEGQHSGAPVVLFCHGGVWAAGSKWHYAPMATRLAQAGVITAVMQYTLYPEVLVPEMVAEVSRALSWTFDHIPRVGGDASKVSLVGHSAGAHMCTMALLHRALRASQREQAQRAQKGPSGAGNSSSSSAGIMGQEAGGASAGPAAAGDAYADGRMPARLVGIAGVYDIAKHFEYEEGRDVHELSTMKRACGGVEGFPSQSPAVILAGALAGEQGAQPAQATPREPLEGPRAAAEHAQHAQGAQRAQQAPSEPPAAAAGEAAAAGQRSYYRSFDLRGEAIARRIGFERASLAAGSGGGDGWRGAGRPPQQPATAAPSPLQPSGVAEQYDSYLPPAPPALWEDGEGTEPPPAGQEQRGAQPMATSGGSSRAAQQAQRGRDEILSLNVGDAQRLPPCLLMSSFMDITVPWFESSEMYWLLHDCRVPAKHLVYNKAGHADFVVGWRPRAVLGGEVVREEGDLPDFAADLVKVVTERVEVQYSRPRRQQE